MMLYGVPQDATNILAEKWARYSEISLIRYMLIELDN